jgi:hypothetical protein
MTGIGDGEFMRVQVADSDEGGREVAVVGDVDAARTHLEHDARGAALKQVGLDIELQTRHDGRRTQPSTRHVADREREASLVDFDEAVPVATDVVAVCSGDVSTRDLKVRNGRIALGKERSLQGLRDRSLLAVEIVEVLLKARGRLCRRVGVRIRARRQFG